ncbi:alpha/beta fold hydrolase [Nonomuraea sp. LPB2021202275-12-8]|uniref:alpha/beta fold hydrolase n=1 Tax=Nonomuraea sp. LPB2021202275-12-8 TaxID=3120159 RepID=UPI00300D0A2C
MPAVNSADGTTIAYERTGSGPALVLVDGAMCYRGAGPMRPLAAHLRDAFTVHTYDRRGRGESSDTMPYAAAREVEDLQAVIAQAGGEACVYGISSGAALALLTAAAGPGITKLALYEPPYLAEVDGDTGTKAYTERLHELLDAGRAGDAVALFMTNVGVPAGAAAGGSGRGRRAAHRGAPDSRRPDARRGARSARTRADRVLRLMRSAGTGSRRR